MSHYKSILLYVYERLAYIFFCFITRRMNCVNFKWFSIFFYLSLWEIGQKLRQDLHIQKWQPVHSILSGYSEMET